MLHLNYYRASDQIVLVSFRNYVMYLLVSQPSDLVRCFHLSGTHTYFSFMQLVRRPLLVMNYH